MALPTIKQGEFNYYGQPEFVDRIINAWKSKNARNNSYKLQGFYGTVYKVANVNVENTEYYVKQIIPSHYNATFLGNMEKIIREIEISNILTGLVPDSVSNLMGARVPSEELINEGAKKEIELRKGGFILTKDTLNQIIDPDLAYSYLIFEGPEGMTVDSAFRLIGDSGKSNEERLKDYLAIICSAKAAIDSASNEIQSHLKLGTLDNVSAISEKFDLATLFMTVEHVADPNDAFTSLKNCLSTNGRIAIVCHNRLSFVNRVLRTKSPIFDIEHQQIFSKKGIVFLFQRMDMDVEYVRSFKNTYSLQYWIRLLPIPKSFRGLLEHLPSVILRKKVSLNVGNIMIIGCVRN
jgi:SAM-dependent methyltransferase